MRSSLPLLSAAFAVLLAALAGRSEACNEAVCASIVSKCALLKSCECEIVPGEPCTCCERCKLCLGYLLTECCSCFELCPKPDLADMTKESMVFDFDPVPELWDALIVGDVGGDAELNAAGNGNGGDDRWDTFTFPVDIPPGMVVPAKKSDMAAAADLAHAAQETLAKSPVDDLVTVNCTVVYVRECIAKDKCKKYCGSLGAASGRWFEDGCCECVGHHCLNYGVNESRCSACAVEEDDDFDELSDEELDQQLADYQDQLEKATKTKKKPVGSAEDE